MAGLDPAIHDLLSQQNVDARDKPGHDDVRVLNFQILGSHQACPGCRHRFPGSEITRLATSRFQMNSTTSAPMVAVMKPAP
jgi:hypothetical protein